MKIQDALDQFNRRAEADFLELLQRAEKFLAEHQPEDFELSVAVTQWSGTPRLPRSVESKALAIVDALRHLHALVAAGVEAERPLVDLDEEAERCSTT